MTQWVYETAESEEMERPICRSLVVNEKILGHEKNLTDAISAYDFSVMNEALTECQGIDIAMKLRKSAEVLNMKLEHELKIKTFFYMIRRYCLLERRKRLGRRISISVIF